MTSVIFNDPSGSDYLYKFSGVQLNAPSGETLALGANAKTADNSNVILTVGDSYIRIPQGVSAERPTTGYAGMIRYLTSENLIEYFNASDLEWQSISLAPPSITSVSPTILNQGTNNTISLTGKNFNTFSNIQLIGTDSSIFTPDTVNNTLGSSNLTFTCLSGNTILDNSSVEPFYIKLTNNDTGFSTQTSPILNINQGSYFILPPGPNLGTFPVQDPCANFYIQGGDTDHPDGNDVSFAIVSANLTPGGFVLTNTSDISATFAPAPGSRTDALAQTYNFQVQMTDSSGAKSSIQPFSFSLANPVISSISPSSIFDSSLIDITITGNYFVIDSSISFINSLGNLLTYSEVSYNSITSLTVKDVSGGSGPTGQYDISVNNGSVVTSNPSVFLSIVALVGFTFSSTTNLSQQTVYVDSGNNIIGAADPNGYTILILKCSSTSSNATGSISVDKNLSGNVDFLVIGGGGGGGQSLFAGGGGAGDLQISAGTGYNTGNTSNTSSSVSFINSTTYNFTVGTYGTQQNSGNNSILSYDGGTITCIGGGRGGGGSSSSPAQGGSGGGGNGNPTTGGAAGNGTNSNSGGSGASGTDEAGGGGGGALTNGGNGNGNLSSGFGGPGGSGVSNITIEGTTKSYAGGGGGGRLNNSNSGRPGGSGGTGGGGRGGGSGGANGVKGTDHTGSGGGGAGTQSGTATANGGAGGSGIIVIRFPSFA